MRTTSSWAAADAAAAAVVVVGSQTSAEVAAGVAWTAEPVWMPSVEAPGQ